MAETGVTAHQRNHRNDSRNSASPGPRSHSTAGTPRVSGAVTTANTDEIHHVRRGSTTASGRARASTKSSLGSLLSTASDASKGAFPEKVNPKDGRSRTSPNHVPLEVARERINIGFVFVGQQFIYPLFAKTIMPATKVDMLRGVRAALIDIVKNLKDVEADEELKWQSKGDGRKQEGIQRSEVSTTCPGNRNERVEDLRECLDNLQAAHKRLANSHGNNFGASYHFAGWEEFNGNKDFERFSEEVVHYASTGPSLDAIIDVLGIVNQACVALTDWRDRYDWEGIRKVKEDLDAFDNCWLRNKLRHSGQDDGKHEVKEEELENAKVELIAINDRAKRLKAEGKERKEKRLKKFDAENRLGKAMKEMHALWEARQNKNASASGQSRKWYRRTKQECITQ